jgi:ABC-type polysaccharide/polyol phosphate export permease
VLGLAWYLINPLVLMGAYWFLFGVVLPVFETEHYPLFLLCGLVVWIFFSQALTAAATSLLDQGALIRKARFPRETIPAAVVAVQLVTFVAVFVLVAVACVAIRGRVDVAALLVLPLVLVALAAFALGLGLLVAILHAYYRDVAPILGAALLPWFFLSPIFFSVERITQGGAERFALEWLNPVAPFILAVRDVLYAGEVPGLDVLAYCVVAGALALLAGRWLFRRLEPELAVVV